MQQHYAQQQQQQHSSYAAPGGYARPASMAAPAYAAQPAAYAAAPMYPPQQQPGYGEKFLFCSRTVTLNGNRQPCVQKSALSLQSALLSRILNLGVGKCHLYIQGLTHVLQICLKMCGVCAGAPGQYPGQMTGRPPPHSARPVRVDPLPYTPQQQPMRPGGPPRPGAAYANPALRPPQGPGYPGAAGRMPLGPPGYGPGAPPGYAGPASQVPLWQRQRR